MSIDKLEQIKKLLADDGDDNQNGHSDTSNAKDESETDTSDDSSNGDSDDGDKKVSIDAAKAVDSAIERVARIFAEQKGSTSEADVKSASKHLFQSSDSSNRSGSYDLRKMRVNEFDLETVEDISEKLKGQKVTLRMRGKEIEWDASSVARTAGFFKAILAKDTIALKAVSEGVDNEGGYLTPTEFRAEVVRELFDIGVMRGVARVIPMNTDSLEMPTLSARPAAYWKSEHAVITTSSAEFGQVTLTPYVLITRIPASREIVADSAINIVSFFTQLFAEEIARAEDKAFFTGSGSGRPTGVNQASISTVSAGGVLNFDDLISVFYKLQAPHRRSPSAAFIASRRIIEILRKVKDNNGNYIWQPSVQLGQPDRILGIPVLEQNDISEDQLYFADWSYYFIGDRETLAVETTLEGGTAWERHRVEIKAYERVDGEVSITSPFAKITGIQS